MSKSSNITDFFKPSLHPHSNKSHPPDEILQKSRAFRRPRSNTPGGGDRVRQKNENRDAYTGHKAQADHIPGDRSNGSDPQLQSPRCGPTSNSSIDASVGRRMEDMEPLGSQGPVLTSSQRVVKNGEVMIRNSDDEPDSDSSLDDIDELLVARKFAMISPEPTEHEPPLRPLAKQTDEDIGASTRSRTRGVALATDPDLLSSRPVLPKYKFSLESLQQRTNHDRASEVGAAKARLLLDAFEQQSAEASIDPSKSNGTSAKVDAALLVSVMKEKGEQEDTDRLLMAIRRTEAFHQGKSWSFFDDMQSSSPFEQAEAPIPQDRQWQGILTDTISRQQAFLGGYIGDMAAKGSLPDELVLWILDAVCFETRDDLKNSYIYTLEQARDRVTALLTPFRIEALFQRIGASTEALNIGNPINPVEVLSREKQDVDWSNLLSVLRFINSISSYMNLESRTRAICMLCRLLLDTAVVKDCEAMVAIDSAISSLVDCIPEQETYQELQALSSIIYPFVADSSLRLQMLRNIPAYSPRLSLLRRRLSLAFLFEDKTFLRKGPKDLPNLRSIASHLEGSRFTIRHDTDYAELAMLIGILSIGVDSGDPPSRESGGKERAAFNADVDLLTAKISGMFTQIVDTGASHMMRTKAKEALEAFQSQLRYAIRSTPKPKSMMPFEDSRQKRIYDFPFK